MKVWQRLLKVSIAVLILGTFVVGCSTQATGVARGWASGISTDGTLIVPSNKGSLLAIDASTGQLIGTSVPLTTTAAAGILSCGGPKTAAITVYGSPAVKDNLVYLAGYDGRIYSYLLEATGLRSEPRWIYPRSGTVGSALVGGVVTDATQLYFGTSAGTVMALDAADGFKQWEFTGANNKFWSTPALAGNTLLIGSFDKDLYALDTVTGKEKWRFETGGAVFGIPAISDNLVIVGSFDRNLYAIDIATGKQVWKYPADSVGTDSPSNWFWASPVVHNGIVYAPNLDGSLYAVDAKTGLLKDSAKMTDPGISSPVIVGDILVVVNKAGRIFTLDTTNGQFVQQDTVNDTVHAPLFTNGNKIYIHTLTDKLFSFDVTTRALQQINIAP